MVSRTVTTAWCTELGTTLLNGFTNTTDNPAYFRCLNSFSVHHRAWLRRFLFPWSRHAGAPLLRNSRSKERAASRFLARFVVRAAPVALLRYFAILRLPDPYQAPRTLLDLIRQLI